MPSDQKKKAYRSDITYVTNSSLAMTQCEQVVTRVLDVGRRTERGKQGADKMEDRVRLLRRVGLRLPARSDGTVALRPVSS